MRRTSVSRLKASLSAYLRGVKAGEEVVVTERGRPVARLVPATETGSERTRRLAAEGVLRPGDGRFPPKLLKASPARDAAGGVLQDLLEERRGGR
jgi:prevent-host-death family protein